MFRSRVPVALVGASLVAAALAVTTPAAASTSSDLTLCPAVGDVPGTPVRTGALDTTEQFHGKVTDQGTTPTDFTAKYIDTVGDGNERVLLFKLSGSRVTKTDGSIDAGIWSGMSGAPVYDDDDQLVGAVAYSFNQSEGTDIAGVTPAESLLSTSAEETPAEEDAPRTVRLAPQQRKAVTASGSRAQSSLRRLEVPRVVVGASKSAADRAYFLPRSRTLASAGRSTDVAAAGASDVAGSTLVPGGNIATAYSAGDQTFANVGTVTAVCGDRVFAFGHPVDGTGATSTTLHSAATATIQPDGPSSFAVVNIDESSEGKGVTDGNYGFLGQKGASPSTQVPVTTTTTYGSATRSGVTTTVSEPLAISSVVANQMYSDYAEVLGRSEGAGTATVTMSVDYEVDGQAASEPFTRTQTYSSRDALALESLIDTAGTIESLQLSSDEDVAITSVQVTSRITSRYYRGLAVDKISTSLSPTSGFAEATSGKVTVKGKKDLYVKVEFKRAAGSKARTGQSVVLKYGKAGNRYTSGSGKLRVFGANTEIVDESDDEFFYGDEDDLYFEDDSISLPDLLEALQSVRQDEVQEMLTRSKEVLPLDTGTPATVDNAIVTGLKQLTVSYKK